MAKKAAKKEEVKEEEVKEELPKEPKRMMIGGRLRKVE